MRTIFYYLLILFIILIIFPYILLYNDHDNNSEIIIKVYHHRENKTISMNLDNYLKGVLAAEMPASFELEALKAQAVAARTYVLKHKESGGSREHPGADICTDYRYSQAWYSEQEMKEKWGFIPFFYYWAKVTRAVEETKYEVIYYNDKLIDAVYHSNAGGQTEDAQNVWGKKIPYLLSVNSPHDKENPKNYLHKYKFTIDEFEKRLGINLINKVPENKDIFNVLSRTEAGRIQKIKINSINFTGSEIRDKLGLPSCNFTFTLKDNEISTKVVGNGHGVGMSQDGANGFARNEYTYVQILKQYYPGTSISTYK